MTTTTLYNPTLHTHLLPHLATLHITCITTDHTLATFLPPFSHTLRTPDPRVLSYWETASAQVAAGTRVIVMAILPLPGGSSGDGSEEEVVAGCAMLDLPFSETGPFRGMVQKVLVDPRFRRRGVARAVMGRLEEVAREKGRTVLALDTIVGTPAEVMYPRLGYNFVGTIPKYGIHPGDGRLVDSAFFYKDLRHHETSA